MKFKYFAVFCIFLVYAAHAIEITPSNDITNTIGTFDIDNPKSVSELLVQIKQSGSLLPQGDIKKANITIYIPQDDVESLSVVFEPAGSGIWKKIQDDFGNDVLYMEFENIRNRVSYSIVSLVRNSPSMLSQEYEIGTDQKYLQETENIVITPEIAEASYPFEQSLKKSAELTEFVYNIMDYDISLVGERKSSEWVFANRRGVCVEYSNLLAAMLRASGIPVRYVTGYAYSFVDKKLIGHTWVEVLAKNQGKDYFVPFDPTWLEAGYVDATHIVTGRLLDDSQKDKLSYFGSGTMQWVRDSDEFDVLDYKKNEIGSMQISTENFAANSAGYVRAVLTPRYCSIFSVNIVSCVDESNNPLLDFAEPERVFWSCDPVTTYWVYPDPALKKNTVYTCPVRVFEQTGFSAADTIRIEGESKTQSLYINGPDTASLNEAFTVEASAPGDFIFFTSRKIYDKKTITESFSSEGVRTFYLYSQGALAEKNIGITRNRQFSIEVIAQATAYVNETINITVNVKNLLSQNLRGNILLTLGDKKIYEGSYNFKPGEEKRYLFTSRSESIGENKITASVSENTLASYSRKINIYETSKNKSFLDSIIEAIRSFFSWIGDLL